MTSNNILTSQSNKVDITEKLPIIISFADSECPTVYVHWTKRINITNAPFMCVKFFDELKRHDMIIPDGIRTVLAQQGQVLGFYIGEAANKSTYLNFPVSSDIYKSIKKCDQQVTQFKIRVYETLIDKKILDMIGQDTDSSNDPKVIYQSTDPNVKLAKISISNNPCAFECIINVTTDPVFNMMN